MCYRPDDECYKWWHEAGGWDITYPSYRWYKDNSTMNHQITEQNKAILDFCYKHNLTLQKPGREWLRNEFNIDADFIFEKDDLVVFLAKREQLKEVESIFSVSSI